MYTKPSKKLQALFNALKSKRRALHEYLPIYSRIIVEKPSLVWSYDGHFSICGTCAEDLKIVRSEIVKGELKLIADKTDILPPA